MQLTKYLSLSHLRKLLSALGQRFYAIEQRQDNLQSQIPTKVSDLNNDVGYQTQAQVESTIAQNAEIVVVNLTSTTTDGVTTYTADKTYAELYAAYAAGKTLILFRRFTSTSGFYYHLLSCSTSFIAFWEVARFFGDYTCFMIKKNNTIVKETYGHVRTINGKYNDVTLTYSDVGALPDSTVIPANVSDLNNDAGYQTQAQVNALIAAAGDDDTTYAISMSGNVITLTGSDGNTSTVTLPVYTGGVV